MSKAKSDEDGVLPPNASKELGAIFEKLKANSDTRKEIYDRMEAFNKIVTDAENKKAKAEKKVHPKFNRLDTLDKGIK